MDTQVKAGEKQKVTLTIASSSGGEFTDEFSIHLKIQPLKVQAMTKFKLDPSMAHNYHFVYNDNVLDESKSLKELGIPDAAELLLEPKQPEVI